MLNTSLGRFRLVALLEGLSFVLLLFVAMPLKYMAGLPLFVKYVGWAHGLLFVLFFMTLAQVYMEHNWSLKKVLWCVVASFIPFGTFVLDYQLLKKETGN
jgi:integral membrane protein